MSTDRAGDNPPEQEAAAPGDEAVGAAGSAAGAEGAPQSGPAASVAALAAAVRAVESGERSAASFFAEAPRAGKPAAPAARPAAGGTEGPGRGGQSAPAGPAPAPTRPTAPDPAARDAAPTPAVPAARPAVAPAPGIEGVRRVLAAGGAPEALAERAAETLGQQAAEALTEDPWQLLAVPGVRPEQADGFARALLGAACGPGDERRAQALIGWLLEQAALAGHSALEASALRAALAQRAVPDPDEALQDAIADGAVLVFQDALETPGRARAATDDDEEQPVRVLLGLDRFAMAEESVADGLARLLNTFERPADEPTTTMPGATTDDAGADGEPPAPQDTATEDGPEAAAPEDAGADDAADARVHPSAGAWAAVATAAPSSSAAELIQTVASSGLTTHTGGEAARAEPAAQIGRAHV